MLLIQLWIWTFFLFSTHAAGAEGLATSLKPGFFRSLFKGRFFRKEKIASPPPTTLENSIRQSEATIAKLKDRTASLQNDINQELQRARTFVGQNNRKRNLSFL